MKEGSDNALKEISKCAYLLTLYIYCECETQEWINVNENAPSVGYECILQTNAKIIYQLITYANTWSENAYKSIIEYVKHNWVRTKTQLNVLNISQVNEWECTW